MDTFIESLKKQPVKIQIKWLVLHCCEIEDEGTCAPSFIVDLNGDKKEIDSDIVFELINEKFIIPTGNGARYAHNSNQQ